MIPVPRSQSRRRARVSGVVQPTPWYLLAYRTVIQVLADRFMLWGGVLPPIGEPLRQPRPTLIVRVLLFAGHPKAAMLIQSAQFVLEVTRSSLYVRIGRRELFLARGSPVGTEGL